MKSNFRIFNDILSTLVCGTKVEWTNTYTPKENLLTCNEIKKQTK